MMKTICLSLAALSLAACATTQGAVGQSGQAGASASSSNVYQFAVPDDGSKLNAASGANLSTTLSNIIRPLEDDERRFVAKMTFFVLAYNNCVKKGYASYAHVGNTDRKSPEQCDRDVNKISALAANQASAYGRYGRPDTNRASTMGGVLTPKRNVGTTNDESWGRYMSYSGGEVHGMTRTELLAEYTRITGGRYAKPRKKGFNPFTDSVGSLIF